ncbi:MAG TPA: molybdopterin converting factor subunit 1 [Burkholderiales bacterium]|nr:molybdopterin converting factor subunit 1 [Burkholderiales bacterium]
MDELVQDRAVASQTRTVTVLYFARLKEAFGRGSERIVLPQQVGTVADLRELLRARGGVWEKELAAGRAVRAAVNQDMAEPATPIRDGDEVALFPPVTGG